MIETYRRKPTVAVMVLWDGSDRAVEEISSWTGLGRVDFSVFHLNDDGGAAIFNTEEHCWIPVPIGHRIIRGPLGEFYPISPAALEKTYEAVEGATDGDD
jgi:hypothetical protein